MDAPALDKDVLIRCVRDRAQIHICFWRVEVWMAGWLTAARLEFTDVVDAARAASELSPRWQFARGVER